MKSMLRAVFVGVMEGFDGRERDGLVILNICWGRAVSINSVLEWFRDSIFDVIHDDMSEIVCWTWVAAATNAFGVKEIKSWVSSA